jgi:hypothetical protein
MNITKPRNVVRTIAAAFMGCMLMGSAALTVGVIAAPSPASATTIPPWEPDANSVGGLLFFNSAGQSITGGSITDSPIAAYVEGTATVRAGDTKATLYGYLPVLGETPGEWSGESLGASTAYPNASAPAPLNTSTLPVETGGSGDETVAQLESDFPNLDNSNDGYADMYVLRLKTSAVAKPANTTYDSADIEISGDTWSVVYPVEASATTTTATVNPTSTTSGSSVLYSASVTSGGGTPTGTVAFTVGSTAICTTPTLVSGAGSCSASNAPVGSDTVTATYSGTSNFSVSVGTTTLVVTSGPYSPLAPVRICDTRPKNPSGLTGAAAQCNGSANVGTTLAAGGTLNVNVANSSDSGLGSFGVPADATAVVLNVTAVNPGAAGYLTVFPDGATRPLASNINYVSGQVVPNLVEVGIGTGGDVSFYSSAKSDVIVDVEGYTAPTAIGGTGAGLYNGLSAPARICDTRAGNPSNLTGANAQCNGPSNKGETLSAGSSINV